MIQPKREGDRETAFVSAKAQIKQEIYDWWIAQCFTAAILSRWYQMINAPTRIWDPEGKNPKIRYKLKFKSGQERGRGVLVWDGRSNEGALISEFPNFISSQSEKYEPLWAFNQHKLCLKKRGEKRKKFPPIISMGNNVIIYRWRIFFILPLLSLWFQAFITSHYRFPFSQCFFFVASPSLSNREIDQ